MRTIDCGRDNEDVESINKIIQRVLAEGKLGGSAQVAELWEKWGDIVGENVAEHCFPEKISEGKLYVRVDSSVWHQQLDLLKEELKEKINRKQQKPEIEKIIFRSATLGEGGWAGEQQSFRSP